MKRVAWIHSSIHFIHSCVHLIHSSIHSFIHTPIVSEGMRMRCAPSGCVEDKLRKTSCDVPPVDAWKTSCDVPPVDAWKTSCVDTAVMNKYWLHGCICWIHSSIHFIRSFIHSFHSFVHSFHSLHSFIHSFVPSFICSLHSFIHPFIHSFIHTHSFIFEPVMNKKLRGHSCNE